MDLATLAFSIDSSDTLKAAQALDALRQTTQATTQANQDFQTQGDFLVTSMASQGAGAARLSRQLGEIGDRFQDLMTQAEKARSAFDGSAASFASWDIAQNKVEALGRAYGTTARGLDAYLQTAHQLQMSSTQAAASVQRLTMALENQGAAAANIRQILSNNGVNVGDLQTDQIDTLLTRIKQAFQSRPDSQQRTNDLRSVLGTFDPDVLGTFTNPNYVPMQERKERQIKAAQDVSIARQDNATRMQTRDLEANRAALGDYESQDGALGRSKSFSNLFGLLDGSFKPPMGATEEGIRMLREQADPDSAFARDGVESQAGRVAFYKQARGVTITQDMLDHPDRMTAADKAAAAVQSQRQFLPVAVTDWWKYMFSGQYSANEREIDSRNDEEGYNGVNIFQRIWDSLKRDDQAVLGTYKPIAKPPPEPTALDQSGTGDTLAGFGDSRIQRYQQAMALEKTLGVYQGNTGGDTLDDAVGKKDPLTGQRSGGRQGAALATFTSAYGTVDGTQNFTAAQVRAGDAAQRTYLDDSEVQDANLSLGLSRQSLGDSAKSRAFIAYMQKRGVPTSQLAGRSLDDLLDPSKAGASGIQAGAIDNFTKEYDTNTKAFANEADRQQTHDLGKLGEQAGVASSGSANLQDLITYQNTYDQVLGKTNDALLAQRLANEAVTKSEAERSVQVQKTIGDLENQNAAAEKYNTTLSDPALRVAGADRTAAGLTADITTQVDAARRANLGSFSDTDAARMTADKQAALGLQATKDASDKVALGEKDLQTQQRLLSVAGARAGIQDKMNRDIQVEVSFEKELAEAKASGNSKRVKEIQSAIAEMKRLKDAVTEVNLAAKAFTMGRDADRSTKEIIGRMAVPEPQRPQYDATAPARALADQRQNGAAPGGGNRFAAMTGTGLDATQNAFLQTVAGPESRGGDFNLRYTPNGGAHFDDLSQHPNILEPIKGSTQRSSAAGALQITGSTWAGLQKQYGYTDFQPATQLNGGWHLAADTYKQATGGDLETDLQDPSKHAKIAKTLQGQWPTLNPDTFSSTFGSNLHAQPGSTSMPNAAQTDMAVLTATQALARQQTAKDLAGAQEVDLASGRNTRTFNAAQPFVAKGDQVGATDARLSQINDADPLGPNHAAAEARAAQIKQEQEYQNQLAATSAATQRTIKNNQDMAVAYGDSTKAVQELQDKQKVETEALTTRMSQQQQLERLTQLTTQRITEQTAATEQSAKALRDSNADQKSLNDLGPMASTEQIGLRQAQLDIAAHERLNPSASDESKNDYATQRLAQEQIRQQTADVDKYRSAWSEAQSSTFSALNEVITTGTRAQDVIAGLAKSLANIGLNTLEKGVGNWFTGQLGGLFGASATPEVASAGIGLASGSLYAMGGAFDRGRPVRTFAVGGLIDRPTHFYSSGGETNLAGEMGTEAILPLRRMPNGDLGVSTGSGGKGGSSVVVNAPITVNGNGGSGSSSMDPQQVATMQAQLREAVRQAVVAAIADEKRAGGSLY